jgi:hypothetical protein
MNGFLTSFKFVLHLNNKFMKQLSSVLIAITAILFFSSCGVNHALVLNHNENSTQVNLSTNNFKVIEKVTGSADVSYVLLIGGMNKKQLYENAYSAMMIKANLIGGPRAVVNVVTEEHIGGVPPFYYKRTITVSANVIEFIK